MRDPRSANRRWKPFETTGLRRDREGWNDPGEIQRNEKRISKSKLQNPGFGFQNASSRIQPNDCAAWSAEHASPLECSLAGVGSMVGGTLELGTWNLEF